MHCTYIVSLQCIIHSMEKVLDLICTFREYKTLIMASKLFYVPMQLQPVQFEVGTKKKVSLP